MPEPKPEPTPTHYCRFSRVYPMDAPRSKAGHHCELRETALGRHVISQRGRKRVFCRICDHHEHFVHDGRPASPIRLFDEIPKQVWNLFWDAAREYSYDACMKRIKTPDYLSGWCRHPLAGDHDVCLHQLLGTLEPDGQGGAKRG